MALCLSASDCALVDLNYSLQDSKQPLVAYDLLPYHIKSTNFVLRFDLVALRPRFVFVHRYTGTSYSDLGPSVKEELLWAALSFSNAFKLGACSVSVPLKRSQPADFRFLAFLNVASDDRFLAVFKELWPGIELLLGGDERWRLEQWPSPRSQEESVLETLEAAVRSASNVELVERKLTEPKMRLLSVASASDRLRLHRHQSEPLIGVSLPDPVKPSDSRWGLLDHLHWLTAVLNDLDSHPAIISVSLGSPFEFNGIENIFGVIRFPSQLPSPFQAVLPAVTCDQSGEAAPTTAELAKVVLKTWNWDAPPHQLHQTRRFSDLGPDRVEREEHRSRISFRRVSDNPVDSNLALSRELAGQSDGGAQLLSVRKTQLDSGDSPPEATAGCADDLRGKSSGKKFFRNFFKRSRGSSSSSTVEEAKIEVRIEDADGPVEAERSNPSSRKASWSKEESGPNFARRASQFISNIPENLKVARDERRKTSTLPSAEALSERRSSDALLSLYLFN